MVKGAITTPKLRDDAATGDKVAEATLGQVPSAANADHSTQADSATSAEKAVSAQTAASVGPNGVNSAAIQTAAVGSSEIQNGSVGSADLGFSSVHSSELGPTVLRSESISVPSGQSRFEAVDCFSGEQMLSGGARWGGSELEAAAPNMHIAYSYPLGTDLWAARGYNASGKTRDFIVYALCLDN